MTRSPKMRYIALFLVTFLLAHGSSSAEGKKDKPPRRTIAHSVIAPDYERERLPSGEWKPERYAIGKGRKLDPTERDASLAEMEFDEVAEIIAKALLKQNYLPESDPAKTDLVIVVNWGKTIPYTDNLKGVTLDAMTNTLNTMNSLSSQIAGGGAASAPNSLQNSELSTAESELENLLTLQSMAERARRQANDFNAQLLGFAPDLYDAYLSNPLGGPQRQVMDDLIAEIEATRYFVILQAYDYDKMVNHRELDMRWITRFSIRAQGRDFDEELDNMARAASRFFGAASGKLKRDLLPGEIRMGEVELVDVLEEEEDEAKEE